MLPSQNFVSHSKYSILIVIIPLAVFVIYLLSFHTSLITRLTYKDRFSHLASTSFNQSNLTNSLLSSSSRTLVLYVFGNTHLSATKNLAFFIRTAVRSSHNADYYFILQQIDNKVIDEKTLPTLPSNAHYIQHENKCFDLGTIGWFLSSGKIDKTKYKYFVFLNSSVRGPFIVAYYDNPIWYTIFTRQLNDQIKLMGCTINCENAPHVQSYLWTMDIHTLNFFLKNSTIFGCHESKINTINNGEVLASQILIHSGFQISSLLRKYQGLDFRQNVSGKCSKNYNPLYDQHGNNEVTHDSYEVVFVKAKDGQTPYHDNFERLGVYEKWID